MTQTLPRKVNLRRSNPRAVYVCVPMNRGLAARLSTIAKERGVPRNVIIRELLILGAYK